MVCNNVKVLRLFLRLSQSQLASLSGLSQNSISDIENYKTGCSVNHALLIYRAFFKVICSNLDFTNFDPPLFEDLFYLVDEEAL